MTLDALARSLAADLVAAGIAPVEARLDAELLVRACLGWDRAKWLTEEPAAVPVGLMETLAPLVARRGAREPMAYVLGRCEFWGRDFAVDNRVLIPRPETELVVELALARLEPARSATVVDVGTGSGCLAVTLAAERPNLELTATDVSADALAVARENARRHAVAERIAFEHVPLLGSRGPQSIDLIVSNPPYVAEMDRATLPPEVRSYEPPLALFGGEDGLDVVRDLIVAASLALRPGGWLIVEIGIGQDTAVRDMLRTSGHFEAIDIVADLQAIPRTATARRR